MASEPGIPVLSWCGARVDGSDAASNDQIAFAEALDCIQRLGLRIVPLGLIVAWQRGDHEFDDPAGVVGLSFEGGTRFDFEPWEHPEHGPQPGLLSQLRAFIQRHPQQGDAHASVFALISPETRARLDREHFASSRSWSDALWPQWHAEGLCRIENGSWSHAGIPGVVADFSAVDDWRACRDEVVQAAQHAHWITGHWPQLFAYPQGLCSEYLRDRWFPDLEAEHRTLAAFGRQGGRVTRAHNRWFLPRMVSGTHWRSVQELESLLGATS